MAICYVVCLIQAVVVFIAERKRLQGLSFGRIVILSLLWPLFILIQYPIDIVALFQKNCGWKVIPHTDTTSFENLHNNVEASTETKQGVVENSEI